MLGKWIRKERLRRGWTQDKLAEQLFVEQAYISKLELGRGNPSATVLEGLATVFQTTLEHVYRLAGLLPGQESGSLRGPGDASSVEEFISLLRDIPPSSDQLAKLQDYYELLRTRDVLLKQRGGGASVLPREVRVAEAKDNMTEEGSQSRARRKPSKKRPPGVHQAPDEADDVPQRAIG